MAVILPRSVFIHIPKTGGQWVAAALENSGLALARAGVVHASPDELLGEPAVRERELVFAIVRHPLTWYQSMWVHRMDEEWTPIDDLEWFTPAWIDVWADFTAHCRSDMFEEFVRKCAQRYPDGYVSMLYDRYTAGCTAIGKQESLVEDLLHILRDAREDFQEDAIRKTEERNARSRRRRRAHSRYTSELIDLVMKTEAEAVARFGYQRVPDGLL